jgi:hypothetical protein
MASDTKYDIFYFSLHLYRHRDRIKNISIIVTCYNDEGFANYIKAFVVIILKFSVLHFVILRSSIVNDNENVYKVH